MLLLELDNIIAWIEELDFFDYRGFVEMFELDVISRGIGKLDFFDNIGFCLRIGD